MIQVNYFYMTNNHLLVITTIITNNISNFFNLDKMHFGILYTFINESLIALSSTNLTTIYNDYTTYWIFAISILIILLSCILYFMKDKIPNLFQIPYNFFTILYYGDYISLNVYDTKTIELIMKYIKKYPDFYSKPNNAYIGNAEFELLRKKDTIDIDYLKRVYDDNITPINGEIIKFHDKNYNIRGYYKWLTTIVSYPLDKNIKTNKKDNETLNVYNLNIPYIQIFIDKKYCLDIIFYINKITTNINNNLIKLYYIKVLLDNIDNIVQNSEYLMYNEEESDIKTLEKKYIQTLFHSECNKYWNIIKDIHFNPSKLINMGQPARIGLCLYGPPGNGKSSFAYKIALTLGRHLINLDVSKFTKAKLYQIFESPCVDGTHVNPNNVIFILDEFDITISKLITRKQIKEKIINKLIINNKIEPNNKLAQTNDDSQLASIDKLNDDSTIELDDLLELIQGPVPLNGAIIIATTNKYEQIYKECPALFRPGRLTPVNFDYPDTKLVNEISNFYFQKSLEIEGTDLYKYSISVAKIMEIVIESKLDETKGFEYFNKRINQLILV